jgi:hypothetical protein
MYSAMHVYDGLVEPPVSMMLERMIDITGEFYHLGDLIAIKKKMSRSKSHSFQEIVMPVLAGLDEEIRKRFHPDMDSIEMRLIVQDWIDKEIRRLCRQTG